MGDITVFDRRSRALGRRRRILYRRLAGSRCDFRRPGAKAPVGALLRERYRPADLRTRIPAHRPFSACWRAFPSRLRRVFLAWRGRRRTYPVAISQWVENWLTLRLSWLLARELRMQR